MEVKAKGVEHPVTLFEVLGISGRHKLLLPDATEELVPLISSIPFRYEIVESSQLGHEAYKGLLTKLSRKAAEATLDQPIDSLTNIRMRLMQDGGELTGSVYAKVLMPWQEVATIFPCGLPQYHRKSRGCFRHRLPPL
jgi:adenylate cyclase